MTEGPQESDPNKKSNISSDIHATNKVCQLDPETNEVVRVHDDLDAATLFMNVTKARIKQACMNGILSYKYKWEFSTATSSASSSSTPFLAASSSPSPSSTAAVIAPQVSLTPARGTKRKTDSCRFVRAVILYRAKHASCRAPIHFILAITYRISNLFSRTGHYFLR